MTVFHGNSANSEKFAKFCKICKILGEKWFGAVQRFANLVDLEKCCKMSIWTQKSASKPIFATKYSFCKAFFESYKIYMPFACSKFEKLPKHNLKFRD
jgi:hypothetical protein